MYVNQMVFSFCVLVNQTKKQFRLTYAFFPPNLGIWRSLAYDQWHIIDVIR